jgi:hypothetical protein
VRGLQGIAVLCNGSRPLNRPAMACTWFFCRPTGGYGVPGEDYVRTQFMAGTPGPAGSPTANREAGLGGRMPSALWRQLRSTAGTHASLLLDRIMDRDARGGLPQLLACCYVCVTASTAICLEAVNEGPQEDRFLAEEALTSGVLWRECVHACW